MSYVYATERPWLLTDEGQRAVIKARDAALFLLEEAGAFKTFAPLKRIEYGDTFKGMAIIDRLVELGDVVEVKQINEPAGQHRIFVRARR